MTNQVPQVSFKIVVGDLISLHSFGYDMNLFRYDLFSDLIIFGSSFKIQELTVFLVTGFINFLNKLIGVKKQVPQVSFKIVAGDLISLHTFGSDMKIFGSDLFFDMIICGSGLIFNILQYCL